MKKTTDPEGKMNKRSTEEQQTIDLERRMKNRTGGNTEGAKG